MKFLDLNYLSLWRNHLVSVSSFLATKKWLDKFKLNRTTFEDDAREVKHKTAVTEEKQTWWTVFEIDD